MNPGARYVNLPSRAGQAAVSFEVVLTIAALFAGRDLLRDRFDATMVTPDVHAPGRFPSFAGTCKKTRLLQFSIDTDAPQLALVPIFLFGGVRERAEVRAWCRHTTCVPSGLE